MQRARLDRSPNTMTALSTHDTKRSEDVRARISVISEIAEDWAAAVRSWNRLAPLGDGPLANLLWQAAVGAWPIERPRLHAFAEKAAREAGVSTTWIDSDGVFEQRLHALVDAVYDDPQLHGRDCRHGSSAHPVRSVELPVRQADPADRSGRTGRLPGHRDVGSVAGRPGQPAAGRLLPGGPNCSPRSTAVCPPTSMVDDEGAVKLLVTSRALRLRRDRPELFTGYTPITATGIRSGSPVCLRSGRGIDPCDSAAGRAGERRWLAGHHRRPTGRGLGRRADRTAVHRRTGSGCGRPWSLPGGPADPNCLTANGLRT